MLTARAVFYRNRHGGKDEMRKTSGNGVTLSGTLPAEETEALLAAARQMPYRTAVRTLELPVLRKKTAWFLDQRRGCPYHILELPRTEDALDIGAGAGIIAASLARRFSRVVALEFSRQLSEFMAIRFAQDGIGNVTVVRGDGLRLPFAESAFDLVVVNGVLEWVPDLAVGRTPRTAQLDFLRGVGSVLRAGGKTAIAIENRFYFRHLMGKTPHGEPPYVTVLPRWLASAVTYLLRGTPYRNYVYSYWGYRRLLKEAGFKSIEAFILIPTYYVPTAMISVEGEAQREYFEKHFRESDLNVWRYLEHSYLIVGEK
jgi:SAM-dependent methyltransferase